MNNEKTMVIFEVEPKEGYKEKYLKVINQEKNLIKSKEGFITAERYISLTKVDRLLSVSSWENYGSAKKWEETILGYRNEEDGHKAQFEHFKIDIVPILNSNMDEVNTENMVSTEASQLA
ncbi:MAG: antibiotic biosynthesis monooxygenase [Anaerovoracaceae bacterium]